MRKADVFFDEQLAGVLEETDQGYRFVYDDSYRQSQSALPISLTLPIQEEAYESTVLFPFFDGLIPEGWLLDIAMRNTDISRLDRYALLLLCCKDCIGAVSVVERKEEKDV